MLFNILVLVAYCIGLAAAAYFTRKRSRTVNDFLLAGSGMNAGNAAELMERTGISQVHSSCRGWLPDPTTEGPQVSYAYAEPPHRKDYEAVDKNLVKKLVDAL